MRYTFFISLYCVSFLFARAQKKPADLLVHNAKIYTVDAQFSIVSAMILKDGRILQTGDEKTLSALYTPKEKLDAKGGIIFPGFIDAHSHFLGYGLGLQRADLTGTESWDQVLGHLSDFAKQKKPAAGQWIVGRGWDQNDWAVKEFPTRGRLDTLFPNNPVLLTRVDGHAAIANQVALDLSGITMLTKVAGGEIEFKNRKPTGILIDNAVDLIAAKIPQPTAEEIKNALYDAQRACFAVGLTSVSDCGIDYPSALLMQGLQQTGILKMRIYAMLSDDKRNFDWAKKKGKIKTSFLNVSSFKVYADGALGSRGACLLRPYSDKPGWTGFLLSSVAHFDSVAATLFAMNWQMNTHAIGDSGNRTILKIYGNYLTGVNDRRWRIEHAQVVHSIDFALFKKYSIVPSVQPTHATSDMYWAADRLGPKRIKTAYAYKQLLQQNGWLPLGTDFPVEDISPLKTFWAAVFRIDAKGFPTGGFQMENALSKEEAIRGMTIWAAKAQFEEAEKGSLEKGKFADFVILDKDLFSGEARDVSAASVVATYVGGKKVYQK